jgi:hypothetical protein
MTIQEASGIYSLHYRLDISEIESERERERNYNIYG